MHFHYYTLYMNQQVTMLLPSDVARLVLGYLQEEGLTATSQAFIHESPNLKEYAEHTTADGTIPACVFSVFGKGLTTLLNEYVAAKTKESCHEVPAMLTSLWKKLDFTLNQIKSLQNSPAISANQRTRSRIGVADMARQRVLAVAAATSVMGSSVSETNSIISPTHTPHGILSHSTPISYTALQTRPCSGSGTHQQIHDDNQQLNMLKDSAVQVIVSEHRLNPGPMSPGRRKWDTPRKRGALSGSSGCVRSAATVCSLIAEPQPEEVVDENFPQLVIQNARDKILGDRLLQEKLAENINKILASEPVPQTSKASSTTMEADQSIDEILGLQGEIHMSNDAIHDILEQTESDPAFQALFDLFDTNKTKLTDGDLGDGEVSITPEESDTAGPSSEPVTLLQIDDPGTTNSSGAASEATQMNVRMRAGPDPKTRKSTAPTLLKKTILAPRSRASRIENSSAKLLVSHREHRGVLSAVVDSNRKKESSLFNNSVTPMETDEPLSTPPPPADTMSTQEPSTKNCTDTSTNFNNSTTVPSSSVCTFTVPLVTPVLNVYKAQECTQTQESKDQLATAPSSALSCQPASLPPLQAKLNTPTLTAGVRQMSTASSEGDAQSAPAESVLAESASSTSASSRDAITAVSVSPPATTAAPLTTTSGSLTCPSTSATLTATPVSSTLNSPTLSSSSAPVAATADPIITNSSSTKKAAAESSNVVSLKIIISDNQDDNSSTDTALNQAISSISGDKIPTIYLSSPVKSSVCPDTPKVNLDEVAQAVSGLQNSEAHASPLSSKAGALVASPLPGTSQAQQSYIIQLPPTNPALQGTAASYLLVTEPPTTDAQTRPLILPADVSKGQPLSTSQYGGNTPNPSLNYLTGSALILPSPVKPLMLPVSVMGQNTIESVQVVSNQLVAIPNQVLTKQTEAVTPNPPTIAVKQSSTAGTEQNVTEVNQPMSSKNISQKDTAKGSSHRRILIFDSSAEVRSKTTGTTQKTTPFTAHTSRSRSTHQTKKDNTQLVHRTKPTILGGSKPKRRIETVRCSTDPRDEGGLVKETAFNSKDAVKKNSRKQDHNVHNRDSPSATTSSVDASQPETLESGGQSKSVDRKHNHDKGNEAKTSSNSLSTNAALKSVSREDKEESSRKEPEEKAPVKSREGHIEKHKSSVEMPSVTANKENEMQGKMQDQPQQSTPSSSESRDFSPPVVSQPTTNTQSMATKAPSKTSSLAKQAAEMLQDIQGLNSPAPATDGADHSCSWIPGTSHSQEELTEGHRTPSRQKRGKDGEGTPRHLMPPNTPDVPTCSPASEAGSENSINMAAHTLMILSRAAIARTGTPLKDSLRQEGVAEKSTTGSKVSNKRKQSSHTASPPAKKESKRTPNKKKDRERKKLIDYFPHDLDVDKFLSSLHYDE